MCGLIVEFRKSTHATPLSRLLDMMQHRGREQWLVENFDNCQVGFRRLAITDRNTPQPGRRHGWTVFLCGEIYNYRSFGFCGSECEVLAEGFHQLGVSFVNQLDGMFVIVAVNMAGDVYVFTDRYGQKPFYYYETPDTIMLCNEILPILKSGNCKTSLNEGAVRQLNTFCNIFTNDTLFTGIQRMEPGTWWHLNSGTKAKYWWWHFQPEPMEYEEAQREVRRLVIQAVSSQTPFEVEHGACLSGGIDSGIIANLCGPDTKTFTVGYKGEEDERALAELSGKHHFEVVYDRVRHLTETIAALETPLLAASWMHWGLYELASKYVTVLFDGAGGDELFDGYTWRHMAPNYWDVVNRTGVDDEYCREVFSEVFPEDTPETRRAFDGEHFLRGVLTVVEKVAMRHTIEVRTPFLSNELVDFALRLPYEFKAGKCILKDAFLEILPPAVVNAPKKGFSTPVHWLNKPDANRRPAEQWMTTAIGHWQQIFRPYLT